MAQFYLVNTVTFASGLKLLPGRLVDDTVDNVAAIEAAGGELAPSSTPGIAAAALKARTAHSQRGANEAACEAIMRSVQQAEEIFDASRKTYASIAGALLPAKGVSVHAQVAAGAAVNVATAFTVPFPRRALEIVLGVGGVNPVVFTVVGTKVDGSAATLTKSCAGAGTYEVGDGAQAFETVTSLTSDVDPGGTTDLKTADGFSVGEVFTGTPLVSVDGVVDTSPTALNGAWGGVKPATIPNGTHAYAVRYDTTNP